MGGDQGDDPVRRLHDVHVEHRLGVAAAGILDRQSDLGAELQGPANDGMTCLVDRHAIPHIPGSSDAAVGKPGIEIGIGEAATLPPRMAFGLAHQPLDIGAAQSNGTARQVVESTCYGVRCARGRRDNRVAIFAEVVGQDPDQRGTIGHGDGDLAFPATGPLQCFVHRLRAVGRADDDDTFGLRRAVHQFQHLVDQCIPVVGMASVLRLAFADPVALVDEQDGRCVAPGLAEGCVHLLDDIAEVARLQPGRDRGHVQGQVEAVAQRPGEGGFARSGRPRQQQARGELVPWQGARTPEIEIGLEIQCPALCCPVAGQRLDAETLRSAR